MSDILRAAKSVPGFLEAVDIWLVEASPTLRDTQRERLADHLPYLHWADRLDKVPDGPLFLVANEFFDCLPARQYRHTDKGWQEQMITAKDGTLGFMLGRPLPEQAVPDRAQDLPIGAMLEASAAGVAVAEDVARRIGGFGGAAIIVDYGNWHSDGDTLQAIKAHKKIGPLDHPGQSDLTVHVNFSELAQAAQKFSAVSQLTDQANLLASLGIRERAQSLAGKMTETQKDALLAAFQRLTAPDQMGQLFKAISFYPPTGTPPPGFQK
jgi:SAM-dependent MidA family methyltransferase